MYVFNICQYHLFFLSSTKRKYYKNIINTFLGGVLMYSLSISATSSIKIPLIQKTPEKISIKTKNILDKIKKDSIKTYIIILKDTIVDDAVQQISDQIPLNKTGLFQYYREAIQNIAQSMNNEYNIQINSTLYIHTFKGFSVDLSPDSFKKLLNDKRVDYIEANKTVNMNLPSKKIKVASAPKEKINIPPLWGLDRINQKALPLDNTIKNSHSLDGRGVNVYVMDTGIELDHPEFEGRAINGWDFVDNDPIANDCQGHGTHVAGTIASKTYGVAKKANLIALRIFNCKKKGNILNYINAIEWIIAHAKTPAIVNMSLSSVELSNVFEAAVKKLTQKGILMVASAGNDNSDACFYSPVNSSDPLTVAASDHFDYRAYFSNYGHCVDIFAPGRNITSTWINKSIKVNSGTSMAAPHVAGVAALYLQYNPNATPSNIKNVILNNASEGRIKNPSGSKNLLLQTHFDRQSIPIFKNVLQKGIALKNLSSQQDKNTFFTFTVPKGKKKLSFKIEGGEGDADLYVVFEENPQKTPSNDCDFEPLEQKGNNERCELDGEEAGTYHIMIQGWEDYKGLSLIANYKLL
jgi:serine protease